MNLLKQTLFFLLLIGVTTFFEGNLLSAQTNPNRPNILVIIADDLGIDPIQGYLEGGIKANTPHINRLAARGITFTNAWTPPTCAPTRAAMISGKIGAKTGVVEVPGELSTVHTSIFNELERRTNGAYADAVLGKWQIGPRNNLNHPADHGVDHYDGILRGAVNDYSNWEKTTNGTTSTETEYLTSYLTDQAIDWVNEQRQPWFLWLAHFSPHSPFHTPPADLFTSPVTNQQTQYIAMIEALDTEIGRLFANIPSRVLDNTVILFIGDNGTPNNVLQNYPNRRGKNSMYQGGIHVPMVVAGAGVTRQNERENKMVNAVDFYASILEIAGADLPGGIHNSLSFKHLLDNTEGPTRPYNYTEIEGDWTIRNAQYKFIQFANGRQEFYDLLADPFESNNLINRLTANQQAIRAELEAEGIMTRDSWSCNDLILNGNEATIDDCSINAGDDNGGGGNGGNGGGGNGNTGTGDVDCANDNSLSTTNIGCCATPSHPTAYYAVVENDIRTIYSNNYPNHSFCFNPARIPEPLYNEFEVDATPQKAGSISSILQDNNRPRRFFGVALNGVIMSPSPATPFIFTNTQTGEFNWDWVFEANNNQGDGRSLVSLDCASAHSGDQGYHYHGNMFEYVEHEQAGISTTMTPPAQPLHIGWANDGFPIFYRFGPDANGSLKLLQPSYQLKAGERPGDGITAPCGNYNGKYINDYEYVSGIGDLDECNGRDGSITIGEETFSYFYVVTDAFPQISRCMVGTPSSSFDNGNGRGVSTTPDNDNDGYVAAIDCNDNDPTIHPNSEEIVGNNIDENCDGVVAMTVIVDRDNDGFTEDIDCNDNDAAINPGALEIINNEIDEDCDGVAQIIDVDNDGTLSDTDPDDTDPCVPLRDVSACMADDPLPSVFEQYEWLNDIIDPFDCEGNSIQVFTNRGFIYIFVETVNSGTLYREDGTNICQNTPSCRTFEYYKVQEEISLWTCDDSTIDNDQDSIPSGTDTEDTDTDPCNSDSNSTDCNTDGELPEIFLSYPWLEEFVNPVNCSADRITVYVIGDTKFMYIETASSARLYLNLASEETPYQFYCEAALNYNCVELYNLSTVESIWECGNSINEGERIANSALIPISEEAPITSNFGLFPNPTTGRFFVNLKQENQPEEKTIRVIDLQGSVIYQLKIEAQLDTSIELDLMGEASGVYLVQVISNSAIQTKRIVIE